MGAEQEVFGNLVEQVRESVEQAEHLEPTDEAAIALALEMAKVVDDARESGSEERIHRASCVAMPSLHKVLTSLGLNPEGRQKLGLDRDEEAEDW